MMENKKGGRNYTKAEDKLVNIPQPICVKEFPEFFAIKIVIKLNCQFLNILTSYPVREQSHCQNDRVIYSTISFHKSAPLPKSDYCIYTMVVIKA